MPYRLSSKIPNNRISEAIAFAESFEDERERALALSAFPSKTLISEEWMEKVQNLDFFSDETYYMYKPLILSVLAINKIEIWLTVFDSINEIECESAKAQLLYELAPKFPHDYINRALKIGLEMQTDFYRAHALEGLLPYADLDSVQYADWCQFLQTLAFLDRSQLLKVMPTLGEIISNLAGDEALLEVAYAIRDVGQQWQ